MLKKNKVNKDVPCVLESTGDYHLLALIMLHKAGFKLHRINPILTKKYQNASIRGAKTDPIDARRLAEIGIKEENLQIFNDEGKGIMQKKLFSLLNILQKTRQRLTQSFKQFKETEKKLREVNLIGDFNFDFAKLNESLSCIDKAIEFLEEEIVKHTSEKTKKLSQIKGVSEKQIATLTISIMGKKFNNKNQLVAFFGLDIRVKESGMWKGKGKLSKRGNSFLRKILFQIGWSLKTHNETYKEYYNKL